MSKEILIKGMSCQHCINHVTNALKEIKGITKVNVDLNKNNAVIESDSDIKDTEIIDKISDAGYEVEKIVIK